MLPHVNCRRRRSRLLLVGRCLRAAHTHARARPTPYAHTHLPTAPCPPIACLPQNEVVSILQQQAKIEPGFTQLVWQKLEEQNPEFFR